MRLDPEDKTLFNELVTITGQFPQLVEGEALVCEGSWQNHKRFGRQFVVERYSSIAPPTNEGLEKYLASSLIKGIGPEYAHRIVAKFGDQTLEIIDKEPERLRQVKGIGKKRYQEIMASWQANRSSRDVMVFLQGLGISASYASRVFKVYGASSMTVIRENPYRLAIDVHGIGFKTADKIAQKLNFPHDSRERARAGLVHVLGEMAGDGHVCCPADILVQNAVSLLEVGEELVQSALVEELTLGMMSAAPQFSERPVYLRTMQEAEQGVAEMMMALSRGGSQMRDVADGAIDWVEKRNNINLAPSQREAIEAVLQNKITVITGGPGVGKTTIINCIIPILAREGMTVLLGAPTGRAAKRLEETTRHKAQTIHRLLKWNPATSSFMHNADQQLECDALIIDETSMMDITLMRDLLLAVPSTASLVLVGDVDQLPSVGPGNVLRDIIESGIFPVKKLDVIFRQDERSPIIWNAHQINHGLMPDVDQHKPADQEGFFFIERNTQEEVRDTVLELCTNRVPKRFGLDPAADIQVMAPMYKGIAGVSNLNLELRARLNPNAEPSVERFGRSFAAGDKVMQVRNDYDKDVFNGDIGKIGDVNRISEKVTVNFDGRLVEYKYDELDNLQPAYAISVHKSQGNEYPAVIIALGSYHYVMLQRNLIYTAVTRGARLVVIVGDRKALGMAVRNDQIRRRHTRLAERIQELAIK